MANIKISQLPQVNSVLGTDVVPTVASSATSKITITNLANSLPQVSSSISASYSGTSLSASYATTASFAVSASWAPNMSPVASTGTTIYSTTPAAGSGLSTIGSIFLGNGTGFNATNANNSFFASENAGVGATNANNSFFVGNNAGQNAIYAQNSIFLGEVAGYGATNASFSTLIGVGAGKNLSGNGIGSNNIIIGTNITLENDRANSINIGGIIFGTGSYSNPVGAAFSGTTNGRVGINVSVPEYTLDVSGSFRVIDGFTILEQVSQSLNFTDNTAAAAGGVPLGGLYRSGSFVLIRLT